MSFKVNEYITLKLENEDTNIYIKGQLYTQCKFLLLKVPTNESKALEELRSVDEAAERLDASLEPIGENVENKIPPEVEFWGHCSNLQVWYENNYDSRLLHRNLAFPMLKRLLNEGDYLAQKVLKEEIIKRLESGFPSVVEYLVLEGYLEYFNEEELDYIIKTPELVNGLVNSCHKDEEDQYQYDGLYFLLDKLKKPSENLFKELLRLLLKRNDLRLTHFLERTDLIYGINHRERACLLLDEFEAEAVLKIWEVLDISYKKLGFSIYPIDRKTRVYIKDKHIIELDLDYLDIKYIPTDVLKFKKLETLSLRRNQISIIPNFLQKMKQLTRLNLAENNISKIPIELCHTQNLKILILANNKITEIPTSIERLEALKRLIINNNEIRKIPTELSNLKNLRMLNLRGNNLDNIPLFIEKIKGLTNLNLSNNKINEIPIELCNLKNLKELNLSKNKILNLPDCIEQLDSLEILDISYNNLSSIPETISNLKNLKKLNCIQKIQINVPESIKKRKKLDPYNYYF